ncbi:MAG: hypothetical protein K2G93_02790 [Rikenella sp.]|nr:hypothetical protein [Rikenella sp.]
MLYYVGSHGFSWASSVTTGTTAYYLGFNYDSVRPNNSSGHAYGFQLRCLQE